MGPSNGRKQVTYAHRRTRNRVRNAPSSSPLKPIVDAEDGNVSRAEMSRRMLKRARRSHSAHSSKKCKTTASSPVILDPPEAQAEPHPQPQPAESYQTPHPTLLTQAQVFKLNSSRPVPSPPAPSSRNLKENATAHKPCPAKLNTALGSLSLASPFSSRPSSAASSPKKKPHTLRIYQPQPGPKRTLSDTHYNANLPAPTFKTNANANAIVVVLQVQSTTTSPQKTVAPSLHRRPSAPSALRPSTSSWILPRSSDPLHPTATPPISAAKPDFDRAPSQLGYYPSDFGADAQGASTPFASNHRLRTSLPCGDSPPFPPLNCPSPSSPLPSSGNGTREGNDAPIRFASTPPRSITKSQSVWLSDSLISPPTGYIKPRDDAGAAYRHSVQYSHSDPGSSIPRARRGHLGRAYGAEMDRDEDVTMRGDEEEEDDEDEDDTTLGLGVGLGLGLKLDGAGTKVGGSLKSMFESLDLGLPDTPPSPSPSRLPTATSAALAKSSLQSQSQLQNDALNVVAKPGRARRGTIRASDYAPVLYITIPAPSASASANANAGINPNTNVLGVGARRTRSGTVVGPQRAGVGASGRGSTGSGKEMDVVMGDAEGTGVGEGAVDVDADELLMRGRWFDEDWVVAEPPSPVVPRQKRPLRKRGGIKVDSVMVGYGAEEGEEDELLLKAGENVWE